MSPRQKFRQSDHAKGWNSTVDSAQFQAAADAATFHFLATLSNPVDPQTAAANEYRRQGAASYRDILENLNTETQQTKSNERPNLVR